MKIALIGYGKMGKAIEEIAQNEGDEIMLKITSQNKNMLTVENLKKANVAIEFTNPHSAVENIKACIDAGIPVVSGSTGWLKEFNEVKQYCEEHKGGFLYASNFSVGVNLFFALNKHLASVMNLYEDYNVSLEEIHHTQKKDAPSGTAITLAKGVMKKIKSKTKWINSVSQNSDELEIISKREDEVPGTHIVKYTSDNDSIEIKHTAFNRQGFAQGAVLAAKFLVGKKGIYSMHDVLDL